MKLKWKAIIIINAVNYFKETLIKNYFFFYININEKGFTKAILYQKIFNFQSF